MRRSAPADQERGGTGPTDTDADADAALRAFVGGGRTAPFRSARLLCGDRDEAAELVRTTLVTVVPGGRRPRRAAGVSLTSVVAHGSTTAVGGVRPAGSGSG